jgi:signal transduction histidine kinase
MASADDPTGGPTIRGAATPGPATPQPTTPEEAPIEEQLRELQIFHEAAHRLSATLELDAVLQEVSGIAASVVWPLGGHVRRAQVHTLDGDRAVVAAETDDLRIELHGLAFPLAAHPALSKTVALGRVVVEDVTQETLGTAELRQIEARLGTRKIACAPLWKGGEVFGVVSVIERGGHELTPAHVERLEVAAALADLAIGNSERLATVRHEAQRLGELEGIKSHFLRLASHELRGPLGTLRGYTSLLREGAFQDRPEHLPRVFEMLDAKARHMTLLVNQMLEAARLEDGRMHLIMQPLDLREPVRQAFEEVALLAPSSHQLEFVEPPEAVPVQADATRIISIANNLLDNAIKYSPGGGTVRCRIASEDGSAVLEVTDHGLGIASEDMATLFTRFGRIVTAENSHVAGTGLGLYLCRELARMHGGDVTVSSQRGSGSTFRLRMPRLQEASG